ncbi:hypothetical protein IQ279_25650 [Streptomyces verrucosisporus]|uniref:hypothetical protein n=1 Tax=Streptomyces verrucosisporus TaxID=1695161 RepID=UPI0019D0B9AD|nr:hypothetical protein [Streptomyces verrucosisporus]MBN3932950.1 hypothetical protein [Streptomyces verrucosisporus]
MMAVAGLPGVGKTELVLQAADQACRKEGWFPGGVLFADMQGYRSPESDDLLMRRMLRSFLAALGVSGAALHAPVRMFGGIAASARCAGHHRPPGTPHHLIGRLA